LREGTKGTFNNISITGHTDAVEVQHSQTVANAADGSLTLTNVTVANSSNSFKVADAGSSADSTAAATMLTSAVNGSGTGADSGWNTGWTKGL